MKGLSTQIFEVIVDEYGTEEVVRRLADPYWFQALACTLAYDWHSSGTTTVVCGVLKSAIDPEKLGFCVVGGKGKASKKTISGIATFGDKFGLNEERIESAKYASRVCAKVDSATIQDGYRLYHHSMVLSEKGSWAVIQQGMNTGEGYARRYQWSDGVKDFVCEPHSGIICDRAHEEVLNMVSKDSAGARDVSVDLVNENPDRLKRMYETIRPGGQASLLDWTDEGATGTGGEVPAYKLPKRVNWAALKRAYEIQPKDYEEMIGISGIGPATVRGLSLVCDLIYGERASWKDPVKYSFAFGGKDGVPYPVDRKAMDESTELLKTALQDAKIEDKERLNALKRLRRFAQTVPR